MHDFAKLSPRETRPGGAQGATIFALVLFGLALAVAQILIGGVKLIYGLPACVLLGAAGIAAAAIRQPANAGKPLVICLLGAAALAGYVIWRTQTSPIPFLARTDFFLLLGALGAYALTAIHFTGSRSRLWLMWILFGLAMLHVAVGVKQFSEGQNFMLLPWMFRPDYDWRASGFYICPNHLAGLLEMLAMMALSIVIWGRVKTWARVVAGYCFVVALVGVAFSGSRGGYLSTIGGLACLGALSIWAVRHVQRQWFWGMMMVAMVGISGVVGTAVWIMGKSASLQERMGAVYDPANMRLLMWKAALETHQLSPWLGVGPGTYLYYGRHFRDPSVQNDPQHVHSDYLELLCEYGIIGCVILALFLVPHLIAGLVGMRGVLQERLRPLRLARSNELALLIGALSALGALLLHSVIDFNMHIPANAMVCALLLGIVANPRSEDPERPLAGRLRGAWLRYAAPVFAIGLIALSAPRIAAEYYGERARMSVRDQANREAIRYAERALKRDPANPRTHYYLGEAKHNQAMLESDPREQHRLNSEAARAFAEGLKHFPTDIQLLLKLARTLDNLGRFDDAELVFQAAMEADPNFGNVYAYWGYHYFMQKRLLRAEKLYAKAVQLQEAEVAPLGLKDIARYRELAASEETTDLYPIEDEPADETWEPGEP